MSNIIIFLKTREVKSPSRTNVHDAGIDFYVPELTKDFIKLLREKNSHVEIWDKLTEPPYICLRPNERVLIPSGIHCQMARNDRALIAANKSGVATKMGLIFGAQVVDYEYQGEIHLSLINVGKEPTCIVGGMKILQFIETPIFTSDITIAENVTPEEFYKSKTTRGSSGFGSSDNK
jgi:dUTPase